jgi:deoxyribonuclease V
VSEKEKSMRVSVPHAWGVPPEQAQAIQRELASQIIRRKQFDEIRTIAGVDLSFPDEGVGRAAVVVLAYPSLEPLTASLVDRPVTFPYIPGLLAFREAPIALAAFEQLEVEPDLIMVDGQGIAHPRRMGIACHIGLYLDKPTIGCAKSKLTGAYQNPKESAGQWSELRDGKDLIGAVVRTRDKVSPVFVSIGHRIDLPTAIDVVLKCVRGYRLPEPTRWAHNVAGGAALPKATKQSSLFD